MNIVSKLKSVFCRGKITTISNSAPIQVQQNSLAYGQIRSDIYAPQQYGIETAPHVGADTVCLFKGGDIENGYVVKSFDTRYKPLDIQDGDTYLYTARNTDSVHRIWLKEEDGEILIETDQLVKIVCKDADIDVSNDATIDVGNNLDATVENDMTVTVMNDLTATVENDVTATVNNNLSATVLNTTTLTTSIANVTATSTAAITCPLTTWTGNITIMGDILQTGKITSSGDHKAGTISLMTHVHPGDGGTGSGADTGAPIE